MRDNISHLDMAINLGGIWARRVGAPSTTVLESCNECCLLTSKVRPAA
jgi:hypothetical protein